MKVTRWTLLLATTLSSIFGTMVLLSTDFSFTEIEESYGFQLDKIKLGSNTQPNIQNQSTISKKYISILFFKFTTRT